MTVPSVGSRLTAREREIANLLGLGLTNKEIAVRLRISQRTADAHVQNMLNKLGASNRAQIVALSADPHARSAPPAIPPVIDKPGRSRFFNPMAVRLATLVAWGVITTLLLSADHQAGLVIGATDVETGTSGSEISDPFSGSNINTSIWAVVEGAQLRVFQGDGRLAVYVGADSGSGFQAGVHTVCRARGDFDVQVSFELVSWPRLNALWVSLMASGTPFHTYRTSRDYNDNYGAYLPPGGGEVAAVGVKSALRMSRVGSKWSGYYLGESGWSRIASGEGPAEDVGFSLLIFNGSPPFGGREALVYFRDFTLFADRIVCP